MARKTQRPGSTVFGALGPAEHVTTETDEQIDARISKRFRVLESLATSVIKGRSKALIVSGPAGLGKSYTVEDLLRQHDPDARNHQFIKGFVRATGLYRTLYDNRDGKTIVFDDADSIYFDEVSLGILKAVTDTTERRQVSWLAETSMIDENSGDVMPRQFEFNGSIIFITNLDFDEMIEKDHSLTPHLKAMMSRAHYVDLTMKSWKDYLVRIRQVVKTGLLDKLKPEEQKDVIAYIEKNAMSLRELSLRMAIKLGEIRSNDGKGSESWDVIADETCLRQHRIQ